MMKIGHGSAVPTQPRFVQKSACYYGEREKGRKLNISIAVIILFIDFFKTIPSLKYQRDLRMEA